MSKHKSRQPDPFAEWQEWQDHRYDPGYFLGGRIHPFYRALQRGAKRPVRQTPFAWLLLLSGIAFTLYGLGLFRSGHFEPFSFVLGFLLIVAGVQRIPRRAQKGKVPPSAG